MKNYNNYINESDEFLGIIQIINDIKIVYPSYEDFNKEEVDSQLAQIDVNEITYAQNLALHVILSQRNGKIGLDYLELLLKYGFDINQTTSYTNDKTAMIVIAQKLFSIRNDLDITSIKYENIRLLNYLYFFLENDADWNITTTIRYHGKTYEKTFIDFLPRNLKIELKNKYPDKYRIYKKKKEIRKFKI